jgi:hypothetical protein
VAGEGAHSHHLPSVMSLWAETRKIYVTHFKSIAKFIGVFVIIALILSSVQALIGWGMNGFATQDITDLSVVGILAILGSLALVVRIAYSLLENTFPYFSIQFIDNIVHHREHSVMHVIRPFLKWSWIGSLIWLTWCLVAALAGASVLFIIPGIILGVYAVFTAFTFILDHKRGLAAIVQSWWYVRGRWWAVFGRCIALAFLTILPLLAYGAALLVITALLVIAFDLNSPAALDAFIKGSPFIVSSLATLFFLIGAALILWVVYPLGRIALYLLFVKARALAGEPSAEFIHTHRNYLKGFIVIGAIVLFCGFLFSAADMGVRGSFNSHAGMVQPSTVMPGYSVYRNTATELAFSYPQSWELTPLDIKDGRKNAAVSAASDGEYIEVTSVDFSQPLGNKTLTKEKITELLTFLIKQKIEDPEAHGLDAHTPLSATLTTTPRTHGGMPSVYAEGVLTVKDPIEGEDHRFAYKSEIILKGQRLYIIFYACTMKSCTPGVYEKIAKSLEI